MDMELNKKMLFTHRLKRRIKAKLHNVIIMAGFKSIQAKYSLIKCAIPTSHIHGQVHTPCIVYGVCALAMLLLFIKLEKKSCGIIDEPATFDASKGRKVYNN